MGRGVVQIVDMLKRGTRVVPNPSLAASSAESGWLSWVLHNALKNSMVVLLMMTCELEWKARY